MIGKNNFGYAVEKMLKESLQQAVFDSLMHQLVEDFKKQAEPIVKAEVEKVSIKGVERLMSLTDFRDDLNVYVKWVKEREAPLTRDV